VYHKQNLLPVKIEKLDDNDIPAPFNLLHSIDLSSWNGDTTHQTWLALEDDVRELMRRAQPEAAAIGNVVDDDEAMASELFSAVAVGAGQAMSIEPVLNAAELAEVKTFI
jgi:hypothetical protein